MKKNQAKIKIKIFFSFSSGRGAVCYTVAMCARPMNYDFIFVSISFLTVD